MYISLNWLKDYLNLSKYSPEKIGLDLTMKTVEIEGVEELADKYKGIVVGEVVEYSKIPNTEKLHQGTFNIGKKKIQVVFGVMAELKPGDKIPIAVAPCTLPSGNEIKKCKLRGVLSEGMCCLNSEINILDGSDNVHFFDSKIKNGTPLTKALQLEDFIYDIDNKSMNHRPDLWGHYGIARELSAIYHLKLNPLKLDTKTKIGAGGIKVANKAPKLCHRWMGIEVENVKVQPSPAWIQVRLKSIGIKPINNIVDITNYVMAETAQGIHAFDKDKLEGGEIIIRQAKPKEKINTIDKDGCILTKDDIVIADTKKAVALGGVIGGTNSQISSNTTTVILESGNFDAVQVRRTANRLDLRTESAQRVEKSQDPENAEIGLRRTLQLIQELIPGAKIKGPITDSKHYTYKPTKIKLSLDFIRNRIGLPISKTQTVKILTDLSFVVKATPKDIEVTVPSFRAGKDVSIPEDLIEEISRIYGYDNIPSIIPSAPVDAPKENIHRKRSRELRIALAHLGFTEVCNYSFVNERITQQAGLSSHDSIKIENSLTANQTLLRHSLIPLLLKNTKDNLRYFDHFKIFELGRVYLKEKGDKLVRPGKKDKLPKEVHYLSGLVLDPSLDTPFSQAREAVQNLLNPLGIYPIYDKASKTPDYAHPSRYANLRLSDKVIGAVYEVHPQIAENFKIKSRAAIFEINFDNLLPLLESVEVKFEPSSKYQDINADLTIEKKAKSFVTWRDIRNAALKQSSMLETIASVGSPYQKGDTIKYTIRLSYRSAEKQITHAEYAKAHRHVIETIGRLEGITIPDAKEILNSLDKLKS